MYTRLNFFVFLVIALAIGIITSCNNGTTSSNEPKTEKDEPSKNILPICDAGVDQIITSNFVILNGNGQDWDGYIVSYLWVKTTGNGDCIIHDADSPSTVVTGLKPGIYISTHI